MKVTVLAENTAARADVTAEHGLSLLVETESATVLCDGGQSAALLENAKVLQKDVSKVECTILSHGHYDHATGLSALAKTYPQIPVVLRVEAAGDFYHGERTIGIDKALASLPQTRTITDTGVISVASGVTVFADFGDCFGRPCANEGLTVRRGEIECPDEFCHEQAVVVCEGDTRVLISGCAHSGIRNMLARFAALYGGVPDVVLSGFHTAKKEPYTEAEVAELRALAAALFDTGALFYTGHCTGEVAFDILKETMGDRLLRMRCGDEITI